MQFSLVKTKTTRRWHLGSKARQNTKKTIKRVLTKLQVNSFRGHFFEGLYLNHLSINIFLGYHLSKQSCNSSMVVVPNLLACMCCKASPWALSGTWVWSMGAIQCVLTAACTSLTLCVVKSHKLDQGACSLNAV